MKEPKTSCSPFRPTRCSFEGRRTVTRVSFCPGLVGECGHRSHAFQTKKPLLALWLEICIIRTQATKA